MNLTSIRPSLRCAFSFVALGAVLLTSAAPASADPAAPRIVNIYNFIRNSDYRVPNSEEVLFEATSNEIQLVKQAGLPATWALQYDALINPRYQKLLKEQLRPKDEIAAWWEIPQPLAEKAGLKWRGQHEWDPAANVGFSPGYNPEERRKLVDVYMADFKAIFGAYPRTVGSWYIDEVTLAYMVERYHIIASCNCKDQVGTDGYTLWGGYWNQAYYPSRLNAYMPAQTKAGQIDVPIFRMLGSDPIYQFGNSPGMSTLEPVYSSAGGSATWVSWFMDNLIHQPCLTFAYTQAGQENSFGWDAMKVGLTQQIALFAQQAKAGEIKVQTLAQSGEWFRKNYRVTPPTAVVCDTDWKNEDRKTIWYDSRFYRLNILWEDGGLRIRDFHLFDERIASPTHDTPLTQTYLAYSTLPIMDGALWREKNGEKAGIYPAHLMADGSSVLLTFSGAATIKELNNTDLSIKQTTGDRGTLTIICRESNVTFTAADSSGKPETDWGLDLIGGAAQKTAVQNVSPDSITYLHEGATYHLRLASGTCLQLDSGVIRLLPNRNGELDLICK